ncbi:MAG: ATP-binding protein [Nitrosopumilus sp.]|nr:ATP-binding protein [Nitrosopumilus sp.]
MNDDENPRQKQNQQEPINFNVDNTSLNLSSKDIGKTIASARFLNNMDGFWFAISPNIMVNSFDFVTVDNLHNSKTIGIVNELQAVAENEYTDYFSDYQMNLNKQEQLKEEEKQQLFNNSSKGLILAKVATIANTGGIVEARKEAVTINFPVGIGKSVRFATEDEIIFALGIPEMVDPIPAGVIETTNGLQVPISLALTYLAGPDTAHVNASGISGNRKSTYILFLLQSAYQTLFEKMKENIVLIIFNTKEQDLLHIDKIPTDIKERTERLFDILNLETEPFENVTYFLPRGKDGKPNSMYIPKNFKTYSYELADIYDRLELIFYETYDPHFNLSSIIDYIYESWPLRDNLGKKIKTWTDLSELKEYPESIVSHKSSLLHFLGQLQRIRKSPMFIDKKVTSTYLGEEIKKIKSGQIFVIDVATISSVEEQAFVVGDVMKSIDEMYSSNPFDSSNDNIDSNGDDNLNNKEKPPYIFVFIDEINRYIPKSSFGKINAVSEQIMRTVIAGRSRGTILFSAQQFKSATDYKLQENTGLHITAKLGVSELSTEPYSMLDESIKKNIIRLNKGELVMIHSAFRHPIKIGFPKATFKSPG